MPEQLQTILIVAVVVLALCLVCAIVLRMIKAIAIFAVLLVLVPTLCTIMWGDGHAYVSRFASLFTPEIEQQINDGYQTYFDANAEHPIVDFDDLKNYGQIFVLPNDQNPSHS